MSARTCTRCLFREARNTEIVCNTESIRHGGKKRVYCDIVSLCEPCLLRLLDDVRGVVANQSQASPARSEK